jgi:hypothetical protein
MSGKDHAVLVDHDRCNPTELAYAGRDLLDLLGVVRPGVAGIDLQVVDRAHRNHRGERLGQRLEIGRPGFRLAHHGLVDLLMVAPRALAGLALFGQGLERLKPLFMRCEKPALRTPPNERQDHAPLRLLCDHPAAA